MSNTDDNKLMLRRLNTDVHSPCYLLHIRDVNLLLDCCMDLSNLSYFLPKHQLMSPGCSDLPDMWNEKVGMLTKIGDMSYINTDFKFCMLKSSEMSSVFWETIDAILVSNTRSVLGLPFLFENTNFRGKVFATEPVVKFGKILIDDLLNELDQLFESQDNSGQSKTEVVKEFTDPVDCLLHSNEFSWTKFYTRESVTKALDKVHLVAYHEPVDLFGLLTIKGLSAGYGIGSCNWIITSSTEKVAYISHTSLLYSHVLPFDDSAFEDTDILIIGTVNLYASSQLEKTVEEFCHIVVQTLARGGNVLVPSNPAGIIFDLLETAIHAKDNFNGTLLPLFTHNHSSGGNIDRIQNITSDNTITTTSIGTINSHSAQKPTSVGSSSSGLVARSPVFFISNQVHVSLAYSNAYGEWLNAVKEGVLYTADAPFPFQSLLRSGELVALKSLYDCSSSKKLSDPSPGNEYSSHILTSPLLLGTGNSTSSGKYFETSGTNPVNSASVNSNNLVDSAIIALKSSSFRNATRNNHNGSGGIWPNSPCLIFASHPSLRFGPSVHLTRVLAYGGLRSGGRTSGPSHNSIILIESGDYVPSLEWNSKSLCSSEARLRRIISPFLQPDKLSTNQTSFSQLGTPSLSISDTATVYWLPMEARIGVHEIDHLVKRCGEPRLALILPQEVYDRSFDLLNITSRPEQFTSKIHAIPYGQQLFINLPDTRLEQVRLSTKLVSHIKPVYINVQCNPPVGTVNPVDMNNNNSDNANKSKHKSHVDSSQPRNKSDIKRKLSTNNTTAATTTVAPNTDGNKECELKAQQSAETCQNKRKCIALVNGLLTTRDGKHWLTGKQEKLEPDVIQPVKDVVSRSVNSTTNDNTASTITITSSATTVNYQSKEYVQKINMLTTENRVLVSHCDRSSRINPHELIQKLTEHGVTGAYVADSCTARQVYSRFSAYNNNDEQADSMENKDIILFPNPNTVICLHEHGSHIICMDESTRTAIRDTLLLFVHHLDINSVV
ncbi:Integrator complex subunit 9 isoform 1 [Schistosoma japonicum]|uniref:Integrator complex subunit 9 isoform 1 n=2 Tax=Schistosoma japonicum TaxID=6182 RepID=A0A4Z2CPB4_SCHJA|nr:Integrator complex subunit 9 isoform 1 [Schistosoma japonicum]